MARRSPGRCLLALLLATISAPIAMADAPKPFAPPKNRAEWDARREALHRDAEAAIAPVLRTFKAPSLDIADRETRAGLTVESVKLDGATPGVLVLPDGASSGQKVPLVLLSLGPDGKARGAVDAPGFDGPPDGLVLARLGFAVLALDDASPRTYRMGLDAALARPEIDAGKVAVVGIGAGGPAALALMAVDDRVKCGVAAVESEALAKAPEAVFGPDAAGRLHPSTWGDALLALCAPRPLAFMIGEALPLRPDSLGKRAERSARGTYRWASPNGGGLSWTHHGEFPGRATIATRLQWMAGLEHLDKNFRPQGPAPLGHDPEPEPTLDDSAVDLAEKGIAGWAVEMAQRPTTWTWSDGVISCKPGPNEYGWLRAPIEVGEFVFQVEWRVPKKGNAGIFLRARPVPWTVAPGDSSKMRVGALGLDWPSRTGLELQAQDDPGSANRYSSGSLYRHAAPASNPTHPPGDRWNRYTVRARGPRIEVWSNGVQVLDTRIDAYPETLPFPPSRGFIGLQNHGAPAEYRNIRLVRLPE